MRPAGAATRARILAAAKTEFAEHGLAGARINRIADEAQASKERLYAYFPSKESLFAAVVEHLVTEVAEEAAMTGDDLPGYVGRLFETHIQHPENARLHDWVNLTAGATPESEAATSLALVPNLDESRLREAGDLIDAYWDSADLILLITYIAKSMSTPHDVTHRLIGREPASRPVSARRAAAVEATRRLITPRQIVNKL